MSFKLAFFSNVEHIQSEEHEALIGGTDKNVLKKGARRKQKRWWRWRGSTCEQATWSVREGGSYMVGVYIDMFIKYNTRIVKSSWIWTQSACPRGHLASSSETKIDRLRASSPMATSKAQRVSNNIIYLHTYKNTYIEYTKSRAFSYSCRDFCKVSLILFKIFIYFDWKSIFIVTLN